MNRFAVLLVAGLVLPACGGSSGGGPAAKGPGYEVSAISGVTTEAGGPATFTVALTAEPLADVTVHFNTGNPLEGSVSVTSLLFTPMTWATPQIVTVTGEDDAVQDGDQAYAIVFTSSTSADPDYGGTTPPDVAVTNTDDDIAGYTVSAINGHTTEGGGTATFTVVLKSKPTADVTVHFDSSNPLEGTVSATSLLFTDADWDTVRTVTVTGQNDAAKDGDATYSIVFTPSTSTDPRYGGTTPAPDVAVTNWDNDTPGFRVLPPGGLTTTETGQTASFTVALRSPPTANVTTLVVSSHPPEGQPSVSFLTFTPANWETPRVVTVTGQDDLINDGDVHYYVQLMADFFTGDFEYNGLDPADVGVTNIDND